MFAPCSVLIAAVDLLAALKERVGDAPGELLTFADTDALRALEVITARRPGVVTLERLFAATPRGAALINRIKADPALMHAEIRVLSHGAIADLPPVRRSDGDGPAIVGAASAPASNRPLDLSGTRRAPRFSMADPVDVTVDGNSVVLVDLSTCGAQVVSNRVLKPNQRVRMTLTDGQGSLRLKAAVAWASFEIPQKSSPQYRAGIDFLGADAAAVEAYCSRHRA